MTKEQKIAIKLICGKFYNSNTTKLTLQCTNHYFYKDNEKQIIEWIGNIIVEIDRLSEYLLNNNQINEKHGKNINAFYRNEWKKIRFIKNGINIDGKKKC